MSAILYSHDLSRLDFTRIHSWLSSTYWSPGISLERVEKEFCASTVVVGAFLNGQQVGVARSLSDTVRFAYIADVFVDSEFRGRGIARQMTRMLLGHPLVVDADFCYLLTRDAQGVYKELGFEVPDIQGKLMRRMRATNVKI